MQHSETNMPSVNESVPVKRRPLGRYFVLAALLFLALWLGVKGWQIGQAARSLLSYRAQAQTMLDGGIGSLDAEELEELVLGVRGDVLTLKSETAVFMPLTPYLGWVPEVGPTLIAAPALMEMADAGTETAAFAIRGLKPGLSTIQDETLSSDQRLSQLVTLLDHARPDLNQARLSLEDVATARTAITNVADQPQQIQTLLHLADEWLPLAQDMLSFSLVAPEFLGVNGPKQYLILAQNEDELRATGGFLTGVGSLTIENGQILDLSFQDSYRVDDFSKPYGDPPAPLYDFMTLELLVFRDANFWPDFPTSAAQAMELYSYGLGLPAYDGAIAIDQNFLKLLLNGTGPVNIPDSNVIITADNIFDNLRAGWQSGKEDEKWFRQRKSFLGDFASAIVQKVQGDFTAINPAALAQSLYEALQTKRLQIYVPASGIAPTLDELNWDGRLENPPGQDYLMVVDTNMGFNKTNLYIDRSWQYEVDLSTPSPTAHLSLTYDHSGTAQEATCAQGDIAELYWEADTYLDIANQCYWNYLRIYAPQNAALQQASKHPIPKDQLVTGRDWHGEMAAVEELPAWETFANFVTIPQSETLDVTAAYTLPDAVLQQQGEQTQYQLHLQKQAGVPPETVTVTVQLPDSAELLSTTPPSAVFHDQLVTFTINLTTDTNISITYR